MQKAVDATSDPKGTVSRFDVDVTRPILHRIVDDSIHQSNDRPTPRDLLEIGELRHLAFEDREIRIPFLLDFIDHEDVGRWQPTLDR